MFCLQPSDDSAGGAASPAGEVAGGMAWPSLGDAKAPAKKKDRAPGEVVPSVRA